MISLQAKKEAATGVACFLGACCSANLLN